MDDFETVPAPIRYRWTGLAIAIRLDADTDPAAAATLSSIAAAWIESAEEHEWLDADWWC
jgi:hypothetical protein